MATVALPYSYKNGVFVGGSSIEYLYINTTDYQLCGEKYFTLRVKDISLFGLDEGTTYEYNGDLYVCTSLPPVNLIELINTCFECPPELVCETSSFDWTLTPTRLDKWTSTTIVNSVSASNKVYRLTMITVDGISYGVLPHTVWTDATDGNASQNVADYIDAITTYLGTLNIPEFQGSVNLGINGVTFNNQGQGQLQLFFDVGTTVDIRINEPTIPVNGTFTGATLTTTYLTLEVTDTSTISAGDVTESVTCELTDGYEIRVSTPDVTGSGSPDPGLFIPYTLFNNSSLNTTKSWILNQTIATEGECYNDNMATAIITTAEITAALAGATQTGNNIT